MSTSVEFRAAAPTVSTPATKTPVPPRSTLRESDEPDAKIGIAFWAFLEQIEKLRGEYEYPKEMLLCGLPKVLRGDALL